jgi:hypothetical protein
MEESKESAGETTSTSQLLVFLERSVKPRWAWGLVGLAAMLAVIGGIIKLWQ